MKLFIVYRYKSLRRRVSRSRSRGGQITNGRLKQNNFYVVCCNIEEKIGDGSERARVCVKKVGGGGAVLGTCKLHSSLAFCNFPLVFAAATEWHKFNYCQQLQRQQ